MTAGTPITAAYRASLRVASAEVADLVQGVTDFTAPGLGVWNLGGLIGHFLRALRTPIRYLAEREPTGSPLPGAAHYSAAYLTERDRDQAAMDSSVASRGADELASDGDHPAELIREESLRLDAILAETPASRLVPTPFGPLRLDDYLRTRAMEITVHGIDIARALDTTWTPPEALLVDTISLLAEISIVRGSAIDLICALTGRTPPAPGDVLPILR